MRFHPLLDLILAAIIFCMFAMLLQSRKLSKLARSRSKTDWRARERVLLAINKVLKK